MRNRFARYRAATASTSMLAMRTKMTKTDWDQQSTCGVRRASSGTADKRIVLGDGLDSEGSSACGRLHVCRAFHSRPSNRFAPWPVMLRPPLRRWPALRSLVESWEFPCACASPAVCICRQRLPGKLNIRVTFAAALRLSCSHFVLTPRGPKILIAPSEGPGQPAAFAS